METNAANTPGWKYLFAAPFIPLFAGLFLFVTSKVGVADGESDWPMLLSRLDFSFDEIDAVSEDSGEFFSFIGDIGSVNTAMAALSALLVARFALRNGEKWAWWLLLVSMLWVGVQDAINTTRFYFEVRPTAPLPIMPTAFTTLMTIGLVKSYKPIFSGESAPPGATGA